MLLRLRFSFLMRRSDKFYDKHRHWQVGNIVDPSLYLVTSMVTYLSNIEETSTSQSDNPIVGTLHQRTVLAQAQFGVIYLHIRNSK